MNRTASYQLTTEQIAWFRSVREGDDPYLDITLTDIRQFPELRSFHCDGERPGYVNTETWEVERLGDGRRPDTHPCRTI